MFLVVILGRSSFFKFFSVVVFFVLLVFIVGSLSRLYAFSDEFDSFPVDASRWHVYENGGEITINSGVLRLHKSGSGNRFPYIFSGNGFAFPLGHELSIRYRILSPYNYGAGVVFRNGILPNGQTTEDYHQQTYLHIWPQDRIGNVGILAIKLCGQEEQDCSREYESYKFWPIDVSWREFRMLHTNPGIYEVYDGTELLFVSRRIDPEINNIWFGNPEITYSENTFPTIEIDYVRVRPIETEVKKDKIVFIPGMFASWNYVAILNNEAGAKWQIPGWINAYDNLILSLKNAGYEDGEGLFVFPYDWRRKLFDLSDNLNSFISNLKTQGKIGEDEKLDLVGHSYGGLVARAYEYEYGDSLIDQIVAIGSPNFGVTQAYGAWEGLESWNSPWWQNQAIQLLIRFNQYLGEGQVQTLRRLIPSIKDVLPTYEYLKRDGVLVPIAGMNQRNESLPEMNVPMGEGEVLAGKGRETIYQLEVKQRSKLDELMGFWEDGKPTKKLTGDGDGTVMVASARGDFTEYTEIEAGHGELVSEKEGIGALFGRLGLDQGAVVGNNAAQVPEEVLVAVLRSPGSIKLLNSQGSEIETFVDEESRVLWLPGAEIGKYTIQINANGETGEYELHLGQVWGDGADWGVYFGKLDEADETDRVEFKLGKEKIKIVTPNERPEGANESLYRINESLDELSETEQIGAQLKILRETKFWGHKLRGVYLKNGDSGESGRVLRLLDDYDRWSEELIGDAGYEIKKQQVNGQRRIVKNLEKMLGRWKWSSLDLTKAQEKIKVADGYYREGKYALANEYYYSAWLHLNWWF